MTATDQILEAGGLVAATKKLSGKDIDEISARKYAHPALATPIVRLSADNLSQGDDLEMEFLGFETPEVAGPIAYRRRQALGFPGWALINDLKHARYALEIVKEFKKEVRRAKSKPGHAYDGFVAIAKKLGRSVVHFLPSFWEQVGRDFMQLGNNTYASRAFGKAREAERVHALKVDENLRRDVFLEFALSGCLTIKSLTDYGKELQNAHDPLDAWQFFRELCVRRTMGGMPPWSSMAKELTRLLKGTNLDAKTETLSLLEEIIDAPSLPRAAEGFWKSYRKELKELAGASPKVAGILLNMIPEGSEWNNDFYWQWLDYLEEWELLPNLWESKVAAEAGPQGGPAAWFTRMTNLDTRMRQRAFDLLEKMTPAIKKAGEPVTIDKKDRWGDQWSVELDLLDYALELGIEVSDPDKQLRFDLSEWADAGLDDYEDEEEEDVQEDTSGRPRDVVYVAADERYRELLTEAVGRVAGQTRFEAIAEGKQALAEARKQWLLGLVRRVSGSALPSADIALSSLEGRSSRRTFQEFPEAYVELKNADLKEALARTLRGGILDEFGWPALEEAVERLNPDGSKELSYHGGAPFLIVRDKVRAVVVSPTEIIYEHEFQLPKKCEVEDVCFYDGHLSVHFRNEDYDDLFYWSNDPKKHMEESWRYGTSIRGYTINLPDGGSFNGSNTVHAGDTKAPGNSNDFFCDGEHYWVTDWDGERILREISTNGKRGRKSMPRFLEEYTSPETELDPDDCCLMPFGDLVAESPLGSRDGFVGWRVRQSKKTKCYEAEGIDGRSFAGELRENDARYVPRGLIQMPGAEGFNPVSTGSWGGGMQLWNIDGDCQISSYGEDENEVYAAGNAIVPPIQYWPFLKVRDPQASQKLRELTDQQVSDLLDVACKDIEELTEDEKRPKLSDLKKIPAAVDKVVGKKSHPRLQLGVVSIVLESGWLARKLNGLQDARDPEGEDEFVADNQLEGNVKTALELLKVESGYNNEPPLFPLLTAIGNFFVEGVVPKQLPGTNVHWWEISNCLEFRIWSALWECQYGGREGKAELFDFLDAYTALPLQGLSGELRRCEGEFDKTSEYYRETDYSDDGPAESVFLESGGNRYYMHRVRWSSSWGVVEYAPEGNFKPIDQMTIESEERLVREMDGERLAAFVAQAREHEPDFLDDEVLADIANRINMSPAETALIWCGFPRFNDWERNYLPKPIREALKLKVTEADVARESLKAIDQDIRHQLVCKMLSGDPTDAFVDGGHRAAEWLAEAWGDIVPKRVSLPAKMVDSFNDILDHGCPIGDVLEALGDPVNSLHLQVNTTWDIKADSDGDLQLVAADKGPYFSPPLMLAITVSLPVFLHQLPASDPARGAAADAFDVVHKATKDANLLLELRTEELWDEDANAAKQLEKVVGKLKEDKQAGNWVFDKGALYARADKSRIVAAYRPAKVKNDQELERLKHIADAIDENYWGVDTLTTLKLLRSDGFKSIRDRLRKSPVPEGCYEANPLHSIPELVAEVAGQREISEDAACLYLQILTLADPTTANVKLWNDWTTSQYNKAAKELVAKDLVLQAKRSRASRSYFLEGGWEALKLPHLPIESWKLRMYEVTRDSDGDLQMPLGRILCLQPIHEMFARAWQRILDGDEPQYEEVE